MKNSQKTGEYLLISIIIVLAVAASISQTILYVLQVPPGHTFLFVHNYIEDYYYYLHLMRQGWEGNWLATSWMSPEVFPGAFVNTWFLFLGHVAKFINLSLPMTYLVSRVVGAGVLLFLSYLLIHRMFADSRAKRIVALMFVSFSTYWWGWANGQPTVAPLVHEWTELDPLFRISFVPHHLWAKVFMLGAFLILLKRNNIFSIYHLAFVILVAAMGLTNPVAYATFVAVVFLWLLLSFKQLSRLQWTGAGISIAVAVFVSVYHRGIQMTMFPWSSYLYWEKIQYAISYFGYMQALGPTLPLFLIAAPWMWKQGSVGRLLIAWAATSWIGLTLSPFIPLSNSRYLGGYQFIPLAIGAVEGLWIFSRLAARATQKIISIFGMHVHGKDAHYVRTSLWWFAGGTLVLLAYFTVGLLAVLREHVGYIEGNKTNPQVYVPHDLLAAFAFLEKNTPRQSVVLAPYWISTMIPVTTGNRVVAGHPLMTYQAGEKRSVIDEVYQTGLTTQARKNLKKFNVKYILVPKEFPVTMTRIYENATYGVILLD